jgi:hypothetical protein
LRDPKEVIFFEKLNLIWNFCSRQLSVCHIAQLLQSKQFRMLFLT